MAEIREAPAAPLSDREAVSAGKTDGARSLIDREAISAGIQQISDAVGGRLPDAVGKPLSDVVGGRLPDAVGGRLPDDNIGEYDDLKEGDPDRVIPPDYRAPPPPPPPLRPDLNHQAPVSRDRIRSSVNPHRPVEKDMIHIHQVAGIIVQRFAPDGFQRAAVTPHRDGHITTVFYGLDLKGATWRETINSPRRVIDRASSRLEPVNDLVARVCTLIYAMISRYDGRETVPVQLHDPSRERSQVQRETLAAVQDFLRGTTSA